MYVLRIITLCRQVSAIQTPSSHGALVLLRTVPAAGGSKGMETCCLVRILGPPTQAHRDMARHTDRATQNKARAR